MTDKAALKLRESNRARGLGVEDISKQDSVNIRLKLSEDVCEAYIEYDESDTHANWLYRQALNIATTKWRTFVGR